MKKGGKHIVEMTVTDACGNQTVSKETFVWYRSGGGKEGSEADSADAGDFS